MSRKNYRNKRTRDIFAGADDIYQTKNSIAVRRVSQSYDKHGLTSFSDKTTYYPKTSGNYAKAKKLVGRVRYGRY